jgi:hypothetical protein
LPNELDAPEQLKSRPSWKRSTLKRPTGVSGLAARSVAFAVVVALIGVLAILWGLLLSRSSVDSWGFDKFFAFGGVVTAIFCFAFSARYIAIGRGLLKLENWARIVLPVFCIPGLASSPATLMNFPAHLEVFLLSAS